MSEWLQLALALIASTPLSAGVVAGIGWWFKTRREDRRAKEALILADRAALQARIETLQGKVESQLMDALAAALENKTQQAELIATLKNIAGVATAMIAAMERSDAIIAKLRDRR